LLQGENLSIEWNNGSVTALEVPISAHIEEVPTEAEPILETRQSSHINNDKIDYRTLIIQGLGQNLD
jgi:hypothetical protein